MRTERGHKKMYVFVDFKRDKKNIPATVATIEYDPNRTAFIALCIMRMVRKEYHRATGLQVGSSVISGNEVAPEIGNAL